MKQGPRISRQEPDDGARTADAPRSTAGSGGPRWKRWLFRAGALAIGLLLTELLCWAGLHFFGYSLTSLHKLQGDLARTGLRTGSSGEVIHPYLGWVLNPETNAGTHVNGRELPVSSLGFLDDEREIPERSDERLVVVVVGGSVAWQMTAIGEERLVETLASRPEAAGKEIVLIRLALPGYKQPQQLMALNYLLSLGAEFDAVVNVDGYNEIALAVSENHQAGVFLAYPRTWHARMLDVVDPRAYGLSFRLLEARAKRQLNAQAMLDSPLKWSPTRNLIWLLQQRYYDYAITEIGYELMQRQTGQGRGFHADGPPQQYEDEDGLFTHAVDLWANCSLQLERLCAANDAVYVHVLQPNQYLPGSKPMGSEEREDMFDEDQAYGIAVARGYPVLIERGAELRHAGVSFADLTMLFAETPEPIYIDRFCHYNQLGNDMLAEAVANLVGEALATKANAATAEER
jgi:hypothetical protein